MNIWQFLRLADPNADPTKVEVTAEEAAEILHELERRMARLTRIRENRQRGADEHDNRDY